VRSSLASPAVTTFPEIKIGSASASVIFGTCSAFTHVMACQLAESPRDPLHRRLQPLRYLHDCSDCYRLERQLPGGSDPRWKTVPLHGALNQSLTALTNALPWLTKAQSWHTQSELVTFLAQPPRDVLNALAISAVPW
jgi:hypothetical protein